MGTPTKFEVVYIEDPSDEIWWCRVHKRWATYLRVKTDKKYAETEHVCNPSLGGITVPCRTIIVTDVVKAVREEYHKDV